MSTNNTHPSARWIGRVLMAGLVVSAGTVGALALQPVTQDDERKTVDDMDIPLLQENLLKIYVTEKESAINEGRLEEWKWAAEEFGDISQDTLRTLTADQLEDMKKRNKFIFHHLIMEKTNAIQVIHVVDKVLGTDVHLPGEGRAERRILETVVDSFVLPRGTYLRDAIKRLGEALGCDTHAELPPLNKYTISLLRERATGEAIIKAICDIHNLEFRIEGKTLIFTHSEWVGGDDDDELRRIEEEERRLREKGE